MKWFRKIICSLFGHSYIRTYEESYVRQVEGRNYNERIDYQCVRCGHER